MFGSEDCMFGGNIDFEEFGVGGCVESIVIESCMHNVISHMDMSQRTLEDKRQSSIVPISQIVVIVLQMVV